MTRWVNYGRPERGLCAERWVIGFMSTRVLYQCDNRPQKGSRYCAEHEPFDAKKWAAAALRGQR